MPMVLNNVDIAKINNTVANMKKEIVVSVERQGVDKNSITTSIELDMRYVGQNYEVTVPVKDDRNFDDNKLKMIREDFDDVHRKEYFTSNSEFDVEIVNIRVIGVGVHSSVSLPTYPKATYEVERALKGRREVYFDGKFIDTPIYDIDRLMNGHYLEGPAIIEMNESSIVITPNWAVSLDEYKNIVLENKGGE